MTITVNGRERKTDRARLVELLSELGLTPATVAVELNGELVRRPSLEETTLREGDRLEIVRMVCGG